MKTPLIFHFRGPFNVSWKVIYILFSIKQRPPPHTHTHTHTPFVCVSDLVTGWQFSLKESGYDDVTTKTAIQLLAHIMKLFPPPNTPTHNKMTEGSTEQSTRRANTAGNHQKSSFVVLIAYRLITSWIQYVSSRKVNTLLGITTTVTKVDCIP